MIRSEEQVFGLLILVAGLMISSIFVVWSIEDNQMVVNTPLMAQWESPVIDYEKEVIMEVIYKFNPRMSLKERYNICLEIIKRSKQFGLSPFLITGVIAAESSFRPKVVSRCKARGLMQITDTVSRMMGVDSPYDIHQNIYAGTKYLHMLYKRFGDEELVLAAYNAGPTRVARLKRVPRIRETLNYVKKVMNYQLQLQSQLLQNIYKDFCNPGIIKVAWNMGYTSSQMVIKQDIIPLRLVSNQDWCESRRTLILI